MQKGVITDTFFITLFSPRRSPKLSPCDAHQSQATKPILSQKTT